jgi:hypothetical protein
VKVRDDEGVANRIGPEPCAGACEGTGEASVGECIGQPLSRGRTSSRAPTPFTWRKAIDIPTKPPTYSEFEAARGSDFIAPMVPI